MGTKILQTDLARDALYTKVNQIADEKQDVLTFDNAPTENSNKPVKSGGVYTALSGKQDVLTFDNDPTSGSTNPVKSGGVYTALAGKQDTLTAGVGIEINNDTIRCMVHSRNIGERVTSTVPQTDSGLHLLNGSVLSDGIYSDFVEYMNDMYYGGASGIFCTEQEWEDSVLNYGFCGKYVHLSNRNIKLPKYASEEHGNLIYSDDSGSGFIRIFEDGWCVQGGTYSNQNVSNTLVTINLYKSYTDTTYTVFRNSDTNNGSTQPTSNYYDQGCTSKTTSSFTIWTQTGTSSSEYAWETKGYVDVSDYVGKVLYEYVVVATTPKTDIEVDIDEIATDLNGKADVDLGNCTKPHIVESYYNSSTGDWYNLYSNGFCEQGGQDEITNTVSATAKTINLHKAYKDTKYTVLYQITSSYAGSWSSLYETVKEKTTSSFTITYTMSACWMAKGYVR